MLFIEFYSISQFLSRQRIKNYFVHPMPFFMSSKTREA